MAPNLRGTSEQEENAVRMVRSVLTPELLPPQWQNHPHPMGACEGGEHWWLEGEGKLIDATDEPSPRATKILLRLGAGG